MSADTANDKDKAPAATSARPRNPAPKAKPVSPARKAAPARGKPATTPKKAAASPAEPQGFARRRVWPD